MKKGAELALNFMLRLVFGMIAICLINGYLQEKDWMRASESMR